MRDIEKAICSVVESREMRMHYISMLDKMKACDVAELIMAARVSMETKRELFKMLEYKDETYELYLYCAEKILKEFYSGIEEDVTVFGYNVGNYSESAVKVYGFKSTISAQKYIKENYGSDFAEEMWFKVKVKKKNNTEKSFILNSEGDLWYENNRESKIEILDVKLHETELTVPFNVGDIINTDMRPFFYPVNGVIMEKDNTWIRYMYAKDADCVGMHYLKTAELHNLRRVDGAEIGEDDNALYFASCVIDENAYRAKDMATLIDVQNGANLEQLIEMIGNRTYNVTGEWKERVKWLRKEKYDFCRFINSKDIREHVKKMGYEMSTQECAYVVDESYRPIKEKHEAYEEIIKNMPDKKTPGKNGSIHELLKKRMELEKILLDVFFQSDKAVYVYECFDNGERRESKDVYSTWSECIDAAFCWENDVEFIRIEKRWIMGRDSDKKTVGVIFNTNKEAVHISQWGILSEDLSEKWWWRYFDERKNIHLPLPFEKGDILQTKTGGVFVYEPDWEKSYMGGYFANRYCCEDECVGQYVVGKWLDAEYYRKPLEGKDKNLEAVSLYLKGKMSLVKFIEKCRMMK